MKRIFIIKKTSNSIDEKDDKIEALAKESMQSDDYKKYVDIHGYHFTDALAVMASEAMINSNGEIHSWKPAQVYAAILNLNIPFKNRNNCSHGDLCYLANMAYADGFYEGLPDAEKWCLKYAIKIADDSDGYEGMPFMRWLSDTIGKDIKVEWPNFI